MRKRSKTIEGRLAEHNNEILQLNNRNSKLERELQAAEILNQKLRLELAAAREREGAALELLLSIERERTNAEMLYTEAQTALDLAVVETEVTQEQLRETVKSIIEPEDPTEAPS